MSVQIANSMATAPVADAITLVSSAVSQEIQLSVASLTAVPVDYSVQVVIAKIVCAVATLASIPLISV